MSTWLPTAPCTPADCVRSVAPASAPRAALRLVALAAALCAGIVLSPLALRCPAGVRTRLTRRWCRALVHALGVRLQVSGDVVAGGGLLVVANHISWLDIPVLAAVRPARMLAKAEIRDWPVAGALAARGSTLFIAREKPHALPGTVRRIADALRDGSAVTAFPEGSTWCGRSQGPFRRAVFQAALDAGVPVQPMRIRYASASGAPSTAPAFVGDDTLLASLWRIAATRGVAAQVQIRPVLRPGGYPDRRALAHAARAVLVGGTTEGRSAAGRPGEAPPAEEPPLEGRRAARPHVRDVPAAPSRRDAPSSRAGERPVDVPAAVAEATEVRATNVRTEAGRPAAGPPGGVPPHGPADGAAVPHRARASRKPTFTPTS